MAYSKGDMLPHRYVLVLTNLCNLKCNMNNDNYILYRDNNHINLHGSRIVSDYLLTRSETLKALKK